VRSHGKKVVIALASQGIGPDTASRVIEKMTVDEEVHFTGHYGCGQELYEDEEVLGIRGECW
jgi:hypothetical protein